MRRKRYKDDDMLDAIRQRVVTFEPAQQEYLLYVFHMLMDKFPIKDRKDWR